MQLIGNFKVSTWEDCQINQTEDELLAQAEEVGVSAFANLAFVSGNWIAKTWVQPCDLQKYWWWI